MITAELSYNPYLLETEVKFNGEKPRINCEIEKYQHRPIEEWADRIPDIFYNEMNGFDFDLNFIGTEADFEKVKNAFAEKGIGEDEVRLFHKNELESADEKCEHISNLLKWMQDTPDRWFDTQKFLDENDELFTGAYSFIVIRGSVPEMVPKDIAFEAVDSTDELTNTSLSFTPIVLYIDPETRQEARKDLDVLMNRPDVTENQIFFAIDRGMDRDQVKRVIQDLGISSPQIITDYNDSSVQDYMQNYPVTEYIRNAIGVFENSADELSGLLEEKKSESEQTNADTYKRIRMLERHLDLIKNADEKILQRDRYSEPEAFAENQKKFISALNGWKKHTVKITDSESAEKTAQDYEDFLRHNLKKFIDDQYQAMRMSVKDIRSQTALIYDGAGTDYDFSPETDISFHSNVSFPDLKKALMETNVVTVEEEKGDLLGFFKKNSETQGSKVEVTTYYLEQWRRKAEMEFEPVLEAYRSNCFQALERYYDTLANAYHEHLTEVYKSVSAEKEYCSNQLSDDERQLEHDIDWLKEFRDQLQAIERN